MEVKEYEIKVPKSLDSITLDQYQRYVKVINDNKDEDLNNDFIKLKIIEIFCGVSMKEAYELAAVDVDDIVGVVLSVLSQESPLQRRFAMTDSTGKSIEFGFIPNLERISQGEYIDAELMITDWSRMHEAMAVFYRPITGKKGEFYEIEKYEGADKYAAVMKDAPASVAVGAMVFFYHLETALLNATLLSLVDQQEKEQDQSQLESPSEKSGGGIHHFTHWLKGMSLKSKR